MSSVEYLLKLKKNIENQISFFEDQQHFLKEITRFLFDSEEEYKSIEDFMKENLLEEFFIDVQKEDDEDRNHSFEFLKERIEELCEIKVKIEDQLYKVCDHTFVKDYIDTFPERSQPIHYCTQCFCNYKPISI